jgi:hypothetical protein
LAREGSAPVLIVEADPLVVAGVDGVVCPWDGSVLAPWGWARARWVRGIEGLVRPRRGRCRSCGVTHVLLPATLLLRRADGVERIGAGLRLAADGVGYRRIGAVLGVPVDTVRRWLVRARANAGRVTAALTAAAMVLDPLARVGVGPPGVLAGLVGAVGMYAAASRVRFGLAVNVAPWSSFSLLTGGRGLSPGP